jgi:hypothetical protein
LGSKGKIPFEVFCISARVLLRMEVPGLPVDAWLGWRQKAGFKNWN